MNDQSQARSSGMTWPFVLPNVAEGFQMHIQTLLQEQAELLDETQKALARWTKRRQDAIEHSLRTFEAIRTSKDPGAMAAAYSEWLTDSMNRVLADMQNARDEALRLTEIGQKSVMALFQRSRDATAATATEIVSPTAAAGKPRRAKDTPRSEGAHEAREPTAAE